MECDCEADAESIRYTRSMKLVIATPLYPPEIGGPATYAKLLKDGLPSHSIEVELVKFSEVRHLPKIIRHYIYYRRVLQAARHADMVLALDPVSVGLPAMKAAKKLGKKFVVKIVGDYAWEQGVQRFDVTQDLDAFVQTPQPSFFVRKLQEVQTRVALFADLVIVPSPYLKEVLLQWKIPEKNISVIYNGIGLPENIPTQYKNPEEFLIVSAGRRVPWKGFEAIERVAQKHANWRVVIASDLLRTDALGWMKTADVFVLNSRYEGFPHALLEAMTLGTPVIATDTKANKTLVGQTGLLVPLGDDVALEKALMAVAQDPVSAQERARAAQKRMEEFSLPRMLQSTAIVLKQLI